MSKRRGRLVRLLADVDAAIDRYRQCLARTDGARDRYALNSCMQGPVNGARC